MPVPRRKVKTKSYRDEAVTPGSTVNTEKQRHREEGLSSKPYAEPEGKILRT